MPIGAKDMSNFICPVCGKKLNNNTHCLYCENRHSFDLAKSGYVNLLLSQQPKEKRHWDDRRMVRARSDFLDRGYYAPLLRKLLETVKKYALPGCRILDAGCGECWYTSNVFEDLTGCGLKPELFGVDISKEALAAGAKRNRAIELAVASVFRLPVEDASCDIVLSIFAPFTGEEFGRVLKDGGVVIRVIPLEKHLLGLKEAVYDHAVENKEEPINAEGFELTERQEIRESMVLRRSEDIRNLFMMTPYYYKTGAEDQEKLARLSGLETEIEFGILVYRKKRQV